MLIPINFPDKDIKFAAVSATTSGDKEVVAAVTGKQIVVLAFLLTAKAAVNVEFQDTTVGALSGLMPMVSAMVIDSGFFRKGFFRTTAGEALDINLSAITNVGGHVLYIEV